MSTSWWDGVGRNIVFFPQLSAQAEDSHGPISTKPFTCPQRDLVGSASACSPGSRERTLSDALSRVQPTRAWVTGVPVGLWGCGSLASLQPHLPVSAAIGCRREGLVKKLMFKTSEASEQCPPPASSPQTPRCPLEECSKDPQEGPTTLWDRPRPPGGAGRSHLPCPAG